MLLTPRYEVKLENFSGPLDLLLHLIKEKEMDLFNFSLTTITEQFLQYITGLENMNIELGAEYLIMASYLVEIKTKQVLPKEEIVIDDDYEKDNREELIHRLLEYKKIKDVSEYFKEQHQEGMRYLSKPRTIIKGQSVLDKDLPLAASITVDKLANTFLKMLERIKAAKPLESNIFITEISPEEIAQKIMKLINNDEREWLLEELLDHFTLSLQMFVACFIALLDLARHQQVMIHQPQYLEQIYIQKYDEKERN